VVIEVVHPRAEPPRRRTSGSLTGRDERTTEDVVTAWTSAYRDRVGHEPTGRAARKLAREARRLLAEGRPVEVLREAALLLVDDAAGPRLLESRVDRLLMGPGGRKADPRRPLNPVDARILASVRRAAGDAG
jgi:hypothetical protein